MRPGSDHPHCQSCQRFRLSGCTRPFIPATGPADATVLFVGQAPGQDENAAGRNFQGPSGELLWETCRRIGLEGPFAATNVVRCFGYDRDEPTRDEADWCREFLLADLAKWPQALLVAVGGVPLKALTKQSGITKKHGQVFDGPDGRKVVAILHPAFVLRDPRFLKDFLSDLTRVRMALDEHHGRPRPWEALAPRVHILRTKDEAEHGLAELADAVARGAEIAFDTEYAPSDTRHDDLQILSAAVCWEPRVRSLVWPLEHPESPLRDQGWIRWSLGEILQRAALRCHNAAVDVRCGMRKLGLTLPTLSVVDTLTIARHVRGPKVTNTLGTLGMEGADTGGYEGIVAPWVDKVETWAEIPLEPLAIKNGLDVDTTLQIESWLRSRLPTHARRFIYWLAQTTWRTDLLLQENGLLVDWDRWRERWEFFSRRGAELAALIREHPDACQFIEALESQPVGKGSKKTKVWNPNSDDQVRTLLFTVLNYPVGRLTEKGKKPSVDREQLMDLRTQRPHPILDHLIEYGRVDKWLGTFTEGLASKLDPRDGRLHAEFHNGVESGRRGSSPNTQNIPEHGLGTDGSATDVWNARMVFRARPGYMLVGPDCAQQEFRLAACVSGDENMLAACNAGDPHQALSERLKIPRKPAKTINFAIIYGAGPGRIQEEIRTKVGEYWALDTCKRVVTETMDFYAQLDATIRQTHLEVQSNGWVENVLGHRRLLPHGQTSSDKDVRDRACREGWNHKIQSLGHAQLEVGMAMLQTLIWRQGLSWYLLNDMHDGILLEVPEDEAAVAAEAAVRILSQLAPQKVFPPGFLRVAMPVEVKVGTHWGALQPFDVPAVLQRAAVAVATEMTEEVVGCGSSNGS